jgi:hypothetical protein
VNEPAGPAWAAALEQSGLGAFIRESTLLYPAANVVHVLGLTFLVGAVLALDLRLLGCGRRVPADAASRFLTPIAAIGFVAMLASGTVLFIADARPVANNPLAPVKLGLVVFAVVNAAIFRLAWNRRLPSWDSSAPFVGRVQALLSLLAWLGAAACGRLLAYF